MMTEVGTVLDNKKILYKSEIFVLGKCNCGCLEDIPIKQRTGRFIQKFTRYHNTRGKLHPKWNPKYHQNSIEFVYCACGCQKTLAKYHPTQRHERRFIKGHDNRGSNNNNWGNGSTIDRHGYRLVWVEYHPHMDKKHRVREHRLVMEKHLGRYLTKNEDVHHKNIDDLPEWENKHDNRLENLQLVTRSEHMLIHIRERRKKDIYNRECYICHTKDIGMRTIIDKKGISRKRTRWHHDPIEKEKWDCPKHYQQRLRSLRRLKKRGYA